MNYTFWWVILQNQRSGGFKLQKIQEISEGHVEIEDLDDSFPDAP